MGILETVKKGFSLMISSLGVVGIFFVYGVITSLGNAQLIERIEANPANPPAQLLAALMVFSVVSAIVGVYFQAGSLTYFRDKLKGETATLGTLFKSGKRYFLPLLLFGVIITAILVTAYLGVSGANRFLPRAAAIAVSGVIVAAALTFIFAWFLAPYSIVAGNKRVTQALKESVELIKKNFGKILLIGLILLAVGFAVGFVFGMIAGLVGAMVSQQTAGQTPQAVIAIVGGLVNAFLNVFMTATFMYFYLKAAHQEQTNAV